MLFFIFVGIAVWEISWGLPGLWHPDELVHRVLNALSGTWIFDEQNFDYPSLPKYVMYGVGKLVYAIGFSREEFIISARFVSVLLGATVVVFTYKIARLIDKNNPVVWLLSALVVLSNQYVVINAHWAHNDLYIMLFATLTIFFLLKYVSTENKVWLYLSFLSVGFSASSKYNGGILIIAPVLCYILVNKKQLRKSPILIFKTLFIGGVISFVGYGIGTPRAILWLAFYVKRLIPALQHHAIYGRDSSSSIGFLGQWNIIETMLGSGLFYVLLISLFWNLLPRKVLETDLESYSKKQLVLWIALLSFDIPIMVSYNYPVRFFLPLLPIFAIFISLFVTDMTTLIARWNYQLRLIPIAIISVLIGLALLSNISAVLLLKNDARIQASVFLQDLPINSSIEYTAYPPTINKEHFSRAYNYPLVFIKYPGFQLPKSNNYEFNTGEQGINERMTDYLVIDSFTYERFENEYICELHAAECEFFQKLLTDGTDYQKIEEFSYSLPRYLPQTTIEFINPTIQVYRRK
jgi:hypothetical protein